MGPARLADILQHLALTLDIRGFRDYCPNGLQVERRSEVARIVTGVSASMALIEQAVALGADLVVVHHGLIWGAGLERLVGQAARRLALLLRKPGVARGLSLAARLPPRAGEQRRSRRCARASPRPRRPRRRRPSRWPAARGLRGAGGG